MLCYLLFKWLNYISISKSISILYLSIHESSDFSIYLFIYWFINLPFVSFQKNALLPHPQGLPGSQHVSNVRSFVGCARRSLERTHGPQGDMDDMDVTGRSKRAHGFYAFDGESSPYFCVKKCVLPIISPYFDIFWGKMIRMYVLIDCG